MPYLDFLNPTSESYQLVTYEILELGLTLVTEARSATTIVFQTIISVFLTEGSA